MKKLLIVSVTVLLLLLALYSVSLTQVRFPFALSSESFQAKDRVFLNEVELNPAGDDAGHQWIELFNAECEPVDLSGWMLMVDVGQVDPLTVYLPEGTVLQAGQLWVLDFPQRPELKVEDASIELCDLNERVVSQTPPLSDLQDDATCWARTVDGGQDWQMKPCTPGASNASASD